MKQLFQKHYYADGGGLDPLYASPSVLIQPQLPLKLISEWITCKITHLLQSLAEQFFHACFLPCMWFRVSQYSPMSFKLDFSAEETKCSFTKTVIEHKIFWCLWELKLRKITEVREFLGFCSVSMSPCSRALKLPCWCDGFAIRALPSTRINVQWLGWINPFYPVQSGSI